MLRTITPASPRAFATWYCSSAAGRSPPAFQAVEGYCGVATAVAGAATTTADVEQVAAAARLGAVLVLLSPVPDPALAPDRAALRPVLDVTVPTVALSLSSRPEDVCPYRIRVFSAVL